MMQKKAHPFVKYSGCGNDFIVIDNRKRSFCCEDKEAISKLCHRQKGIGADGVLLLGKAEESYTMRIFNADGSEAAMCGNGLRCLAKFIDNIDQPKDSFTILSPYGKHYIEVKQDRVSATLASPQVCKWNLPIPLSDGERSVHFLNTGVPHAVLLVENIEEVEIDKVGKEIRWHRLFSPEGTNATFVELGQEGTLSFRTYERGVEGETLACGTGAIAAALTAAHLKKWKSPIQTITREGSLLTIDFKIQNGVFSDIIMTGPAEEVYHGIVMLG